MNPRYPNVSMRAMHRCEYCRAPESVFNFPFEVEHIAPPNKGGSDDESNLALACRSCNLFKGARIEFADPESGVAVPLFNPRTDHWNECFQVDVENGTILGLSPAGRATIDCLAMNNNSQVVARNVWTRLGLFP